MLKETRSYSSNARFTPPAGRMPSRRPTSPVRAPRTEACGIKKECQSCRYVNDPYASSLQEKYAAGLKTLHDAGVMSLAKALPPVAAPRPLGYRAAIKLAVRPAKGNAAGERFLIGLFKPGTHDVVDLSFCPLHVPSLGRLIRALKRELEASVLQPWDEGTKEGDLRYLALRASHITGELMLTFVLASDAKKAEVKELAQKLRREGHHLHSVHINLNADSGNHIFGEKTQKVLGQAHLRETLCDLKFEISPASFFQVNPWQASLLYRRIEQLAASASSAPVAWDLFCGGGPISMILARAGFRVLGIEENPHAIADGQVNVRRNHLEERVEFLQGRVEEVEAEIPTWAKEPQMIVANPSRRGIAEKTRDDLRRVLARSSQCQFLYVSCDVSTLARDLADLQRSGYKVRQIEAFDMFAQTDKLEWLAVMTA